MTKDIFVVGQDYSIQAPVSGDTILRWVLSPEEAYHGGTSIVIQEFSSSEPGPPPNHPPDSVSRAASTNNTIPPRTKSILVPLFGTQISMHDAQISTIELIYKPCQDDVQVGIHFGLLAVDTGKPLLDSNRMGRKLLKEELLQALHPEFKQEEHLVSNNNSSALPNKDLLCLVTLDDPDRHISPEAGLAIGSQQNQSRLYTRETLSNGWQRLVLHLSGLLNPFVESSSNETSSALYSIVLSQLGITLSCQDQGALLQGQASRPLAVLGSLAVVPTWSMEHKGSYVQGVGSQDTQPILLEHPVQGGASSTRLKVQGVSQYPEQQPQHHPQQQAGIITKGLDGGNGPISISISSTITWNIGFPVDNQSGPTTLASSSSSTNQISTSEYSHYCIYLSLERSGQGPPKEMTNSTGEKEKVAEQGVAVWVGSAFTHRYRISNFEFGLEHATTGRTTTTATGISTIASEPKSAGEGGEGDLSSTTPSGTTRERMTPVEIQRLLAGREIWVWVQGIRRDGRSDERRNWGRSRLL
ncbi:hypothetical protein BGX34_010714 [Mortierella sp. NVP85]|nr:hypothetical protein BGX34_010714 [Mortierella sp. NVP85]